MAHNPNIKRDLSIKVKLIIIAIMLVAINLLFYLYFGSSIVSDVDDHDIERDMVLHSKNSDASVFVLTLPAQSDCGPFLRHDVHEHDRLCDNVCCQSNSS